MNQLMRTIICLCLSLGLSSCTLLEAAQRGVWTRIDDKTLNFTGEIVTGVEIDFERLMTPDIQRLRVRSSGGDVETALKIAETIFARKLDLEVNGYCASSCANYWFPAANKKVVPKGFGLFLHGDVGSSMPFWNWADIRKQLTKEDFESFENKNREIVDNEQTFYRKIGLNPKLFLHSVGYTSHHQISAWIPNPQELECTGLKNLEMWFSENPADYDVGEFRLAARFGTSAQDTRVPKPDLCNEIKTSTQ